jgi:hypothetical protein
MSNSAPDHVGCRSIGRPSLTAALAAGPAAEAGGPSRWPGCRGASPCLPGLAKRPGPASATRAERHGKAGRQGVRGALRREPLAPPSCGRPTTYAIEHLTLGLAGPGHAPDTQSATSTVDRRQSVQPRRAYVRFISFPLPHAQHATLCDSVGEKFWTLHGVDFISVPPLSHAKR